MKKIFNLQKRQILNRFLVLLVGVLLFFPSWGEDFTSNGITYRTVTKSSVHVIGTDDSLEGNVTIPEYISGYRVTKISDYAFYGRYNITSVSLPNGVTEIGIYAFWGCTSLKSIKLPTNLRTLQRYAFADCRSLDSISLPSGLTWIDTDVFNSCRSLTSITFPAGLTCIESHAFFGCSSLTSITFLGDVSKMQRFYQNAFVGCPNISTLKLAKFEGNGSTSIFSFTNGTINNLILLEGVTKFTDLTWKGLENVTSISIPNSVKSVPEKAFLGNQKIASVTMADSLSIGVAAFKGCSNLVSVKWPKNEIKMRSEMFKDCSSLQTVDSLKSLKYILNGAFANCSSLQTVGSLESLEGIGTAAFANCLSLENIKFNTKKSITLLDSAFFNCKSLRTIDMKFNSYDDSACDIFNGCSGLVSANIIIRWKRISDRMMITPRMFENCTSLQTVKINGGEDIGASAFSNCTSLQTIDIGDVMNIDSQAFENCTNLEKIVTKSVNTIGDYAFENCTNLESLENDFLNVTSLGLGAFKGCVKLKQVINLSSTLKNVPPYAFYGCSNIPRVRIPSSIESIGEYAFYGCKAIKTISLPSGLTSIGNSAFCNSGLVSATIPQNVTEIGNYAYADCENLETVVMNCALDVPFNVFENDSKIKSITGNSNYSDGIALYNKAKTILLGVFKKDVSAYTDLPESLEIITDRAFMDCKNLKSILFPTNLRSIGNYAFKGCESLASASMPGILESMGTGVFEDCSSLKTFSCSAKQIGTNLFKNCTRLENVTLFTTNNITIPSETFYNCESLNTLEMSKDIVGVDNYAFYGCKSLSYIDLSKAKTLGVGAFSNCKSLGAVQLSNNLSCLNEKVFEGCVNLVITPYEFFSIGNDAFKGCSNIKKIRVRSSEPNFRTAQTFAENTIIYVPQGAKDFYQAILPYSTIIEDYDKRKEPFVSTIALCNKYFNPDTTPFEISKANYQSVLTDVSQLSANYIDEYEGSLAALLDGDRTTYFMSAIDADNPNEKYHYIQFDMKKRHRSFKIDLSRRSNDELAPTRVRIFTTNTPEDEGSWNNYYAVDLNYNGNWASINVDLNDKMRFVRLQVEGTIGNYKENGNLCFSLNGLNVYATDNNRLSYKCEEGLSSNIETSENLLGYLKGNNSVLVDADTELFESRFKRPINHLVVTYAKRSDGVREPDKFLIRANYGTYYEEDVKITADYQYWDKKIGVCSAAFSKPVSYISFKDNSGSFQRGLRMLRMYDRPSKVELLSKTDQTALLELVKKYEDSDFVRNEDLSTIQNYISKIESAAQTGRYADFAQDCYRTFYADYPTIVPNQVKAGIVKEDNGELVVDYIYNEGDVIPANTGVILKGDCRGNAYVMEKSSIDAIVPEGNLLHGTTEDEETYVEGCNRYYMLSYDKESDSRLGFYWNAEDGPRPFVNKAYKAYLAMPISLNAMQQENFSLKEMENANNTTGIGHVTTYKDVYIHMNVYSIDGRKLDVKDTHNLPAGIYIVNGKKVIVK